MLRLLALLLLVATLQQALAQPAPGGGATERQIKAAYISKFGSYIEWPPQGFTDALAALQIGVMGDDALADQLPRLLAGRTIGGRAVQVHKLRPGAPIDNLHLLFIGRAHNDRLGEILAQTQGRPILTVTESPQGLTLGSVINFVIVDGRVRFEIAPQTAANGMLGISARLLATAWRVA